MSDEANATPPAVERMVELYRALLLGMSPAARAIEAGRLVGHARAECREQGRVAQLVEAMGLADVPELAAIAALLPRGQEAELACLAPEEQRDFVRRFRELLAREISDQSGLQPRRPAGTPEGGSA